MKTVFFLVQNQFFELFLMLKINSKACEQENPIPCAGEDHFTTFPCIYVLLHRYMEKLRGGINKK